MNFSLISIFTFWIPHSVSIIACIIMICFYRTIRLKTQSIKMILVISVSDLIFHIAMIFVTLLRMSLFDDTMNSSSVLLKIVVFTNAFIINVSLRFSLFWACNIAYFLHALLNMQGASNASTNYKHGAWVTLFASLILSIV